ncbi:hypothetical protein GTW68_28970 [Streptomyces sp. SID4945]|nr:hypothetical protein [Streptomyces sp. SID4945]
MAGRRAGEAGHRRVGVCGGRRREEAQPPSQSRLLSLGTALRQRYEAEHLLGDIP